MTSPPAAEACLKVVGGDLPAEGDLAPFTDLDLAPFIDGDLELTPAAPAEELATPSSVLAPPPLSLATPPGVRGQRGRDGERVPCALRRST